MLYRFASAFSGLAFNPGNPVRLLACKPREPQTALQRIAITTSGASAFPSPFTALHINLLPQKTSAVISIAAQNEER